MPERTLPEDFRGFVRELGIQALDQLAAKERARARQAAGISRLLSDWKALDPTEKEEFFERIITAAQEVAGESMEPPPEKPPGTSTRKKAAAARPAPAAKRASSRKKPPRSR